ncbi:MAG TPA: hypothetical protein VMA77_00560 [Solirubrobacteraceae bacterium]|nr:hypothetical protein [Solirubrobacteraceae bacterium]
MSTDPPEQPAFQIGDLETGEATDTLIGGDRVGGPSPIAYMNGMLMRRNPIEDKDGVTPPAEGSGVELFGHTFSYEVIIAYGALAVVIIGVIALLMGPGS